jgi:hypothetical protein
MFQNVEAREVLMAAPQAGFRDAVRKTLLSEDAAARPQRMRARGPHCPRQRPMLHSAAAGALPAFAAHAGLPPETRGFKLEIS